VKLGATLVGAYGEPIDRPEEGVSHLFPSIERLAEADLKELPMPRARRRTLRQLAESLATHPLEARIFQNRGPVDRRLLALPGIGPWTAGYIAMRALRDPDAFLANDAGIRRAMNALGSGGTARQLERVAESWRPYRAYAVQHLWALDADGLPLGRTQVAA
jgi:AraC family transcriptional regulator of adaptative response / DNA-3-methyladenine glycosylase II